MNDNPYSAPEATLREEESNSVEMSLVDIYFSFNGRINRSTYWLKFFLPMILFFVVLGAIAALVGSGFEMIILIFQVLIIWPSLAVAVKRWHDRDKSGWWIFIGIIPIIGGIWALVENGFLAGTDGYNQYGYPQK